MLDRDEMISLIEAAESYSKLNKIITHITNGYCISNPELLGMDNIYEILRSNSRYNDDSDESAIQFDAIIHAMNADPEEKYELLKQY